MWVHEETEMATDLMVYSWSIMRVIFSFEYNLTLKIFGGGGVGIRGRF